MNTIHDFSDNPQPQIKHAGAVNVRGMMIRRWRPRFLELDENGVLRYYEATEDNNNMVHQQQQHRSKILNHYSQGNNNNNNSNERKQQQRQQGIQEEKKLTQNNMDNKNTKHPLKGVGSGSNKDFVHISNDDIMNREMQAFSLPIEFHGETHQKNHSSHHQDRSKKNPHVPGIGTASEKTMAGGQDQKQETKSSSSTTNINTDSDNESHKNHDENNSSDPEIIQDLEYCDPDDDDDSGEVIHDADVSQEIVVTNDMHVNILSVHKDEHDRKQQGKKEGDHHHNKMDGQRREQEQSKEQQGNKSTMGETSIEIMTNLQYQAQNLHHHVHKHRAKAVMTILSARIIDVNSLRDIHVGLPKGTYGFVFCGRQIFSNSDSNHTTAMDYYDQDQCEIRDDICHPLSILSSDHDYFDTSRDYLCSVNTLEEAQNWVSALRSAANVASARSARQRLQKAESMDPYLDDNSFSSESSIDRTFSVDSLRSVRSPPRTSSYLSGLRRNCNLLETLHVDDDHSVSTGEHVPSPSRSEGLTLVTKVTDFGLEFKEWKGVVRLQFEIKYKVKMLVLRNIHLNNRSRKRKGNLDASDTRKIWDVEERTIYRSFKDFLSFTENLSKEHSRSAMWPGTEKDKDEVVKLLEEARKGLHENPDKLLKVYNFLAFKKKMNDNVERTNKVLRSIATDCRLCNTGIVKNFLLKENEARKSCTSLSFFQVKTDCQTSSKYLEVPRDSSIDDFVKNWLFGDISDEEARIGSFWKMLFLLFENPIVEVLVIVSLTCLSYGIFLIWSTYLCRSLLLRLDVLFVNACVIFYIGFEIGSRDGNQKEEVEKMLNITMVSKKKIRKVKRLGDTKKPDSFAVVTKQSKPSGPVGIEEECSISDEPNVLSSPLPEYSSDSPTSSWTRPMDKIFKVRGKTYLKDRIKLPSDPSPLKCRGIDMWITDNPERNISRHPSVLGGKLKEEDTFVVNFLLPFGNFVTYFSIPPIDKMPSNLATVWTKFINGNQQYRDARLKLLPVVVDGPWIVKKAVGHGPALLGQAIPLQYYFTPPTDKKKGVYEVDVIITASRIAKGILNVVKSHTKRLTLAFAFIIEAAKESELPETVLCSCQIHSLHLELCPNLPKYFLDDSSDSSS